MKTVSTILASIISALVLLSMPDSSAEDKKFNLDISSAKVEVSLNKHSSKKEELVAYLKTVLKDYHVISKDDWTHKYSHVADGDSTGTIEWTEDASKVWKWMVRQGGLATVTDENGGHHLPGKGSELTGQTSNDCTLFDAPLYPVGSRTVPC